ncbi:MAG: MBL fold metallo-hydrolase [Treponemataceae bacterium]
MIEEVSPGILRIETPLPGNPLKAVNSYLVRGEKRSLLIDSCFDFEDSRAFLAAALVEAGVAPDKVDFFGTHSHPDHIGLFHRFYGEGSGAYMGRADIELCNRQKTESYWVRLRDYILSHGFPAGDIDILIAGNQTYKDRVSPAVPFIPAEDGTVIAVGGYRLECLWTPGHTPGQTCLYDREKKLLFSGDHILEGISPSVVQWVDMEDSLGSYFRSLEKIEALEVSLMLPGHREPSLRCRQRILELREYHKSRLDETMEILGANREESAYAIASRMKWGRSGDAWTRYPGLQRWFAAGAVVAYLENLRLNGAVKRRNVDGIFLYSI